jgi:hypothetical protein
MPKKSANFHLKITSGRRISDISEYLCDLVIKQLKTLRFALQIDEETDTIKDTYLITYD